MLLKYMILVRIKRCLAGFQLISEYVPVRGETGNPKKVK